MSASLTVLETVYYRPPDGQPQAREGRWTRSLTSAEEPYSRTLEAGPEWQLLDLGWITEAGFLVVANIEGGTRTVRPTPEEEAATAAALLEIGRDGQADWLVAPGETLAARPAAAGRLEVRCQARTARYTLTVYPA